MGNFEEFLFAVGKALGLLLVGFGARRLDYVSPAVRANRGQFALRGSDDFCNSSCCRGWLGVTAAAARVSYTFVSFPFA